MAQAGGCMSTDKKRTTRAQLLRLAAVLHAEDPHLFELPPYPVVKVCNIRWSDQAAMTLFRLVGVDDGMLYADGCIEITSSRTFQVSIRENEDRPDLSPHPFGWVPTISFGVERNLPVSFLIRSLIESALKMGLILEIGDADG